MGKIRIKMSKDDKFYFTLEAANGQTIATSETYESKQGCKDGIEACFNIVNYGERIDETEG